VIDGNLVARVADVLGAPEHVELTERGRTILRYPEFTVSAEGHLAIAAKMVSFNGKRSLMLFAVVKRGELRWQHERPTGNRLKQVQRPAVMTGPAPEWSVAGRRRK
jgi:hypothetical protein